MIASFDLGQAMSRAVRIVTSNLLVSSVLILVMSVVLFIIQMVGMMAFGLANFATLAGDSEPQLGPGFVLFVVVLLAVAFVSMGFSQALMAHAAACDLEGRKMTFSSAWSTAFRHCIPVAVVMLLTTLLVMVGSVFLIIPGIILGVFFGMAAPAQVIDKLGIFGAMGASAKISEGNRWILFAYYLVTYILLYVVLFVVYMLIVAVFGGTMMASMGAGGEPQLNAGTIVGFVLYFICVLALSVIVPQATGAIPAAAYAQFKASVGDRQVAGAFD